MSIFEPRRRDFFNEIALYWTDDLKEVAEICQIRRKIASGLSEWNETHNKPDKFDETGQVLVMRKGGRIVGSARTNVSMSAACNMLPIERDLGKIDSVLPRLYKPQAIRMQISMLFALESEVSSAEKLLLECECLGMADLWNATQLLFWANPRDGRRIAELAQKTGWVAQEHSKFRTTARLYGNNVDLVVFSATRKA